MYHFDLKHIQALFDNAADAQAVALAEIVMDAGTQQRAKTDPQAIENYAEAMEAQGSTKRFPAIKLVRLNHELPMKDGSTLEAGALVLVDGFHRVEAANKAKLKEFQAFIVDGSIDDAIYYSMQANRTNGVNLKGKDYQKAIKKLYTLDKEWQAHGKKKEIAALLGCSTKTVERATKAIDKEIKAEAFKMFEAGASDQQVADFAVISEKTAKEWRKEWEDSKPKGKEDTDNGGEAGSTGKDSEPNEDDPMNLTFNQVLNLKNQELKARLLKILMDSMGFTSDSQGTKQEDEQPEPEAEKTAQDSAEEQDEAPWEDEAEQVGEDPKITELFNKWNGKDCWTILEKSQADLAKMANPKAALKRAYNKQLAKCHSDKYGKNRALDILTHAFSEAKKYFK